MGASIYGHMQTGQVTSVPHAHNMITCLESPTFRLYSIKNNRFLGSVGKTKTLMFPCSCLYEPISCLYKGRPKDSLTFSIPSHGHELYETWYT